MNTEDYIGYYKDVVPDELCWNILNYDFVFQPSSYSNHKEVTSSSNNRVNMDEVWVKNDCIWYKKLKVSFEIAIKKYSEKHLLFSVQHITDFRINRYSEGGFMSSHVDNIHHSHGQIYGYPQVTALIYLNDDYEGGEFIISEKTFKPRKGSAIVFPSNFMFPHEAKVVTKGTRWSIVTWLM